MTKGRRNPRATWQSSKRTSTMAGRYNLRRDSERTRRALLSYTRAGQVAPSLSAASFVPDVPLPDSRRGRGGRGRRRPAAPPLAPVLVAAPPPAVVPPPAVRPERKEREFKADVPPFPVAFEDDMENEFAEDGGIVVGPEASIPAGKGEAKGGQRRRGESMVNYLEGYDRDREIPALDLENPDLFRSIADRDIPLRMVSFSKALYRSVNGQPVGGRPSELSLGANADYRNGIVRLGTELRETASRRLRDRRAGPLNVLTMQPNLLELPGRRIADVAARPEVYNRLARPAVEVSAYDGSRAYTSDYYVSISVNRTVAAGADPNAVMTGEDMYRRMRPAVLDALYNQLALVFNWSALTPSERKGFFRAAVETTGRASSEAIVNAAGENIADMMARPRAFHVSVSGFGLRKRGVRPDADLDEKSNFHSYAWPTEFQCNNVVRFLADYEWGAAQIEAWLTQLRSEADADNDTHKWIMLEMLKRTRFASFNLHFRTTLLPADVRLPSSRVGCLSYVPHGVKDRYKDIYKRTSLVNFFHMGQQAFMAKSSYSGLCLARACIALEANQGRNWKEGMGLFFQPTFQIQIAEGLCRLLSVPFNDGGIADRHWQTFADHYHRPFVFLDIDSLPRVAWQSRVVPGVHVSPPWFFLLHERHVSPILNWQAFLRKELSISENKTSNAYMAHRYCTGCKRFHNQNLHNCSRACHQCGLVHEHDPTIGLFDQWDTANPECAMCFRRLAPICFKAHKEQELCYQSWRCNVCEGVFRLEHTTPSDHNCGRFRCRSCNEEVDRGHKCFIWPKPRGDDLIRWRTLFAFDFEANACDLVHVVDDVEVQMVSPVVRNGESIFGELNAAFAPEMEENDGKRNFSTIDEFMCWVLETGKRSRRAANDLLAIMAEGKQVNKKARTTDCVIFMAHNGSGYDFQFVLNWLLDNFQLTKTVPTITARGSKLLQVAIQTDDYHIVFRDTLCFFQFGLAEFPKAFGFASDPILAEVRKGHFPHFFEPREVEWEGLRDFYVGEYPSPASYGADDMSASKRAELLEWLHEKKSANATFSFQQEKEDYLHADVLVLRLGIERFREQFVNMQTDAGLAPIDPFSCMTAASLAMKVYTHHFMPPQSIAVLPMWIDKIAREAFFGGRTNGAKLWYNFQRDGVQGYHHDIVSLYPAMQRVSEFPVGSPIYKSGREIESMRLKLGVSYNEMFVGGPQTLFGLAHVDVHTPSTFLYFPVLPERRVEDGKLVFDLLPKVGKWFCTPELVKAIQMGYTVTRIYNAIHYEERSSTLFASYVDFFMRLKMHASGWPRNVHTDEEKKQYCQHVQSTLGISLDPSAIESNPCARSCAKLELNSMWGKFGQASHRDAVDFVSNVEDFSKIYCDPNLQVKEVKLLKDFIMLRHTPRTNTSFLNSFTGHTNTLAAAFVTCYGRLRLYEALEYLGRQILYFDTDSVFWACDSNDPTHRSLAEFEAKFGGESPGQFHNEFEEGDTLVGEFVCSAPKVYAYRTKMGQMALKAKGICLSYNTLLKLDLSTIRDAIFDNAQVTLFFSRRIHRDRVTHQVYNAAETKTFRRTYNKRHVLEPTDAMIDTLPFGWDRYDQVTGKLLPEFALDQKAFELQLQEGHKACFVQRIEEQDAFKNTVLQESILYPMREPAPLRTEAPSSSSTAPTSDHHSD